MTKDIQTLDDLTPDDRNANKGTPRGQYMVQHSLEQYGAGRSILVDKNGKIIAGNKTTQAAQEMALPVRVVQSDGRELIVVQRTDLDLDNDAAARALAVADNRASEVGLAWDAEVLGELAQEVDLSKMFFPDELSAILAEQPDGEEWGVALGGLPTGDRAPFQQMTFTLSDEQAEQVKAALESARRLGPFVDTGNENGNGNALARICEVFLGIS